MTTLRLGTRGSELALRQAHWVRDRLVEAHPNLEVEVVVIKTKGDQILDRPLAEVGGKGLFVKEIEHALLEDEVDLAVHSLKDMPVEQPEGLVLTVFPQRADPFDALCASQPLSSLADLPEGARIGTGSLRRGAQLVRLRSDLEIVGIRGNVQTRLAKRDGDLDAVVLASAGLRRLELWEDGFLELTPPEFLPAPAQGILAVETRVDDQATRHWLRALEDEDARLCATAERACLGKIEGDCHTPFAAFASINGGVMHLFARLFDDEQRCFEARGSTDGRRVDVGAATDVGLRVARALLRTTGSYETID